MKKILLLVVALSYTVFAQITITTSDKASIFTIGNAVTVYSDTLQSSVDIGSPGGGNNWDFSGLTYNTFANLEIVDPATTANTSDFSGADVCTHSSDTTGGVQTDIWSYYKLNGTYDLMGSATTTSILPGNTIEMKDNPYRQQYVDPMTFNSTWNQTYTQSQSLNGTPISSSSIAISSVVDAYGTMKLPGGANYDALRIKETTTISILTMVSYYFVAKNGAQVEVSATDSNPADNGTISVDGTNYNGAITSATGVEQTSSLPGNYHLKQNYPNPFNPTTNIEYSIPKESFVQIKVYDILGNEVTTLVNEEQTAGIYRVNFSGNNLASGFYIARLKAGNYIKTIKMTLLK